MMRSLALLALLIAASGCLAKKNVVGMTASDSNDGHACPGQAVNLIARLSLSNGKTRISQGAGGGIVAWKNFKVNVSGGRVDKGVVVVDPDPRTTWTTPATWDLSFKDNPSLTAKGVLNLVYSCTFDANFSGASGANGPIGNGGGTGQSGASGSNPGDAGADGGDGGNGGNGQEGQDGADAGDVSVAVTQVIQPLLKKAVLEVAVTEGSTTAWYAVDPDGGHLTISAQGGAGGMGGSGGRGGDGGSGGSGNSGGESGAGGNGGNGGDGGNGGRGGNGGSIHVKVDPSARAAFGKVILLDNSGGPAGESGAPGSRGNAGYGSTNGTEGTDGTPGRAGRAGKPGPTPSVDMGGVKPLW